MNPRAGSPFNRLLGQGTAVLWVMVVGGILWIFHGYFRFMTPQGPDSVWREDLQYSLILSTELFLLYNLSGVLALLLTSWATLSYLPRLRTANTGLKRAAQILALVACLFGLIAAAGLVVRFVPPTEGGISIGVPVLGLALFFTGLAVIRDGNGPYGRLGLLGPLLMLLGVIGMITLPVQPLIYAMALLPIAFGTAEFALFGAGWVVLGFSLRSRYVQGARTANA
jgi:hypothetical protein